MQSWIEGGATTLSNGKFFCRYHHTLVHAGVLRLEAAGEGDWRFPDRQGREILHAPPLPAVEGDAESILVEDWLSEDVEITP